MSFSPHAVINPPVVLSTGVQTVAQSAIGSAVDLSRLALPFRSAMLLDEIRFSAALVTGAEVPTVHNALFIQTKIALGRFAITDGFVPISVLTPSAQLAADAMMGVGIESASGRNSYSFLRWVFPVPLYVRPGEALGIGFRRITDGQTNTARIEASVVGRVVSGETPQPRSIRVPWVAAYVNDKVAASMSQGSGGPPNTALFNPFSSPLHIQRFVGRSYQDDDAGGLGGDLNDLVVGTGPDVKITDSRGFLVVGDPVVFGEVFDSTRHAWTAPHIMPPKGWVRVQFSGAGTNYVYWVGMVGWREEAIG